MANRDFKARFIGANYHNIDGTGWPDSVVMGNGDDVLKCTYKTKEYVPYRTCHNEATGNFFCCSECGSHFGIAVPRGPMKAMLTMKFCPDCGAKVVD